MNNFADNERHPFREKITVIKKINRMKSLLCDWYGEKSGRGQITAYMPKSVHVKDVIQRDACENVCRWQCKQNLIAMHLIINL